MPWNFRMGLGGLADDLAGNGGRDGYRLHRILVPFTSSAPPFGPWGAEGEEGKHAGGTPTPMVISLEVAKNQ